MIVNYFENHFLSILVSLIHKYTLLLSFSSLILMAIVLLLLHIGSYITVHTVVQRNRLDMTIVRGVEG